MPEGLNQLPGRGIPQFCGALSIARQQARPVGGERGGDLVCHTGQGVRRERIDHERLAPGRSVPEPQHAVGSGCQHPGGVGGERNRFDLSHMPQEGADGPPRHRVPKLHRGVTAARQHKGAIGRGRWTSGTGIAPLPGGCHGPEVRRSEARRVVADRWAASARGGFAASRPSGRHDVSILIVAGVAAGRRIPRFPRSKPGRGWPASELAGRECRADRTLAARSLLVLAVDSRWRNVGAQHGEAIPMSHGIRSILHWPHAGPRAIIRNLWW
jgi:hypothetical protein